MKVLKSFSKKFLAVAIALTMMLPTTAITASAATCDSDVYVKTYKNGYYYTGDKARIDEEGYYWFCGRNDDIIKSSGYRIGPLEVEEVVMRHESVQEVAVVGAPDPLRGVVIKAYIVLKKGYVGSDELVKDIQSFVRMETAPYKYPRKIEFVKALPKSFSGKVKREILRKHAENGGELIID